MDIDRGKMFSLNSSGSAMFQLLAQGLDDKTIVEELARRFGISAVVAKRDLDEFRTTLNSHALIPSREVAPQE
jgi:hypothetical protein